MKKYYFEAYYPFGKLYIPFTQVKYVKFDGGCEALIVYVQSECYEVVEDYKKQLHAYLSWLNLGGEKK